MNDKSVTIITPTVGKSTLFKSIQSLDMQDVTYEHILLWDDKREGDFLYPDPKTMKVKSPYDLDFCANGCRRYSIVVPGTFINGSAFGSSLRSVGLMLSTKPYISFMDDDVWYEKNHLETLLNSVSESEWAFCKRKIWKNTENGLEYIGIDDFESVGDSASRKVPYEMVDNNCMIFSRRFGSSGAVLYRETTDYNDDRLMYEFLKKHAGVPGKTYQATVNQVCPKKLEPMFDQLCTRA